MPTRSAYAPGTFCWTDHQSKDPDAARAFYGDLLGWEFEGPMAMLGGAAVAAILPLPDDSPHPPHWNSYVAVDDADVTVPQAERLGAEVIERPFTIGLSGRVALIKDPSGVEVCLWEAGEHPGAARVNEPGALCWNHLDTADAETAHRSYGELFGWTWRDGICFVGDRMNGSAAASEDPPGLSVFFAVEDLERAGARVGELGGQVLAGPMPAGPGNFIVVADPAGATVCLYAGELEG